MSTATANAVVSTTMAPEIQRARESIDLPEVRAIMRRLADFNLAVCIPHMHRPDVDFAALPPDTVQVEEGRHVRWISRSELDSLPNSIPVAWRWIDDGSASDAECIKTCSWNSDKGSHYKDHL
jgi:hypothetical protein